MQNWSKEGFKQSSWALQKVQDHHHEIKIEQVMAYPSWENFGNFKNCALSKLKLLGQWLNFLDFKYLPKLIGGL